MNIRQEYVWYQNKDGSLDMIKLLKAFQEFYRENSAVWLEKFDYKESGPHLLMMAFLQRVINGGGTIHREYALGRARVDILLCWQQQRIVIELKVLHGKRTLADGLLQTAGYMDTAHAIEGHLIIFDRNEKHSWNKKLFTKEEYVEGKKVIVWGF